MKANPLDQLKRICGQLLSRIANLNNSFKSFFTETMICYLSITGRVNFSQMARFSTSCESRFRQNFKKRFDWVAFNTGLASGTDGHLRAIALDPCYIPKSGKKTPGLGYFWSGTANAAKRGLEILDFAFNASLTAVNLAKNVAKESGIDLSVEDVKLLIHNAVMIQRIFSMFGNTPNMNLNQSIFKELLFYGVKSAA